MGLPNRTHACSWLTLVSGLWKCLAARTRVCTHPLAVAPGVVAGVVTLLSPYDGLRYRLVSAAPYVTHRQAIDICAALDPGQNSILASSRTRGERNAISEMCKGCNCWCVIMIMSMLMIVIMIMAVQGRTGCPCA